MKRERVDIPEVFRRGMSDWLDDDDNGDDGGQGNGSNGGNGGGWTPRPFWQNRRFWLIAFFFFILFSFNWIISTLTDWLWFKELGYQSVWLTGWSVRVGAFAIAFVVAALILLFNWRRAFNTASRAPGIGLDILGLPGLKGLISALALFLSFIFALTASGSWGLFLRYYNRVSFGKDDPLFKQDIGFYLFDLPLYEFLQGWILPLIVFAAIGVVAIYALNNMESMQRGLWRPQEMPALRRHIAFLGAIIVLLWAAGVGLQMFGLVYSTQGFVDGAGYADIVAALPAFRVQLAFLLLLALTLLYNIYRLDLRPVLAVGVVLIGVILIGNNLIPSLIQRFVVAPDEPARERPYIANNIEFTRLAFGLDSVDTRSFGAIGEVTADDLAANATVSENVRVWDYRPLQATYAQLQALRPYYQFSDIDIDRYEINGEIKQVMLAARELDYNQLPANSWVNQRLEFTHGYGVVMNPVDKVTAEGAPEFYIQDIPPKTSIDLEVTRPEIYYGETTDEIVLVGTGLPEFDYPLGSENATTFYDGQGGVPLNSYLKRLLFAIRFGETNMLLSQYIDSNTRLMFHRNIDDRVARIAPFLSYDRDPYLVVTEDGRLMWIQDAYTLSNKFPYSTPSLQNFNYIRNAVKVTIDAYSGEVIFYQVDQQDPLIRSYARAFPGLFRPLAEMPASLRSHLRYPEFLFLQQTQQYLVYHMTDPKVFYQKEDRWAVPNEFFNEELITMEPYYILSTLPGEENPEYLLIQPYTPNERENMIAWLAARNDPENYGELVAYELPKDQLVLGPSQIESRINQDTGISGQISLWNQQGSRVIRGNLLVIPINDSFLYVEPLYLESETNALPELKRVIVASGSRIVMEKTLTEALSSFLTATPIAEVEPVVDSTTTVSDETPVTTTSTLPLDNASVEQLIQSANEHFEAAEAAQRAGDWAAYGEEIQALEADLTRLGEMAEESEQ